MTAAARTTRSAKIAEAARARRAARAAKAARGRRFGAGARTARTAVAAAIGAGVLLHGGPGVPAAEPGVGAVVRTVAVTVPAGDGTSGEPGSDSSEGSGGSDGDGDASGTDTTSSGSTPSTDGGSSTDGESSTEGESSTDSSSDVDGSSGGSASEEESASDGSPADESAAGPRESADAGPERTDPDAVTSGPPAPAPSTAAPATPPPTTATTPGTTGTPTGTATGGAPSGSTVRAADGAVAAVPAARTAPAAHTVAPPNALTRLVLALVGLGRQAPGGPAGPSAALTVALWGLFRRSENPLFNQSPVAPEGQTGGPSTGQVVGRVVATDPDGDRLTYALGQGPSRGTVTVNRDGTYVYTPTDPTLIQNGGTDTFTVVVRDNDPSAPGLGGLTDVVRAALSRSHPALAQRLFGAHTTTTTVTVTVAGADVGTPDLDTVVDPTTGVVRGHVGPDDGVARAYTVTVPPRYGRVTVDQYGDYVYIPSRAAQTANPRPAYDTFTVTVTDRAGGTSRTMILFVAAADGGSQETVPLGPLGSSATPTPVHTVPVGTNSYLVGTNGRYAAVIDGGDPSIEGDERVTVVDTVTGTSAVVPVTRGVEYGDVAFSATGDRIYLVDQTGTLRVADTADGTVVAVADLGDAARGLRLAPDGRSLYVTAYADDGGGGVTATLVAIDTTDFSVRPLVDGDVLNGVRFSPDGGRAYALTGDGTVTIIKTADNSVLAPVPVGAGAFTVSFSPDGSRAYVAGDDGTLTIIHTDDDGVVPPLQVGRDFAFTSGEPRFSPDGRHLYVLDYTAGTVTVVGTESDGIEAVRPVETPSGLVFSPDGSRAYVTGDGDRGAVIDTTTWEVRELPVAASRVVFAPDGSRAYVTSFRDRSVAVVDVATEEVVDTYALSGQSLQTVLSSDGGRLFAVVPNEEQGDRGAVLAIDTATGDITTITVGDRPYGLVLSPDGRRAYVANYLDQTLSVIDTADDTVITTVPGTSYDEPLLSPDGRFVYFADYTAGTGGITFVSTLDDRRTVVRAPNLSSVYDLKFSADGSSAIVVSPEDGTLLVISLDGDAPTAVAGGAQAA